MNLFSFLKGKKPPVKTAKESLAVRNGLEAKSEVCAIREAYSVKNGLEAISDTCTIREAYSVKNGLEAISDTCTVREGLEAKSGVFVIQDDSLKTRSNVYVLQDEFEEKDLIKDIQRMQQLAITAERNLINSKLRPTVDERPKLTVINGGKRGRM